MSNVLFTTPLNGAFSLERMGKPKDKPSEHPMDRVLAWTKTKTRVELAKELELESPQALQNWINRGIPPKDYARVAKIYGRSVDVLLGRTEDDPAFAELMTFWDVLLPQSKAYVLSQAKYIRTIQNPVPDPDPVKR